VWFDALINYISALGFGGDDAELFEKYWPADVHMIGKDITRFHCIIWPAMLMAGGVEVPRSIFAHGFISLGGEKMSKTRGNILDPLLMAEVFGADGLRYLLMREVPFDKDGDISIETLVARYNSDLANELGNLFSRTVAMISKYLGGNVEEAEVPEDSEIRQTLERAVDTYTGHMERMEFSRAITGYWQIIQRANRYIEERRPWDLAKDESRREELESFFRELLMVLRTSAVVLFPFMPEKMGELMSQLAVDQASMDRVPFVFSGCRELAPPKPLFPRIKELPESLK